jgi:hypothetical protein|tara:strand:+ start:96 stop:344 length:249 start_codon:yes stop_codon:yes gene_type:complete
MGQHTCKEIKNDNVNNPKHYTKHKWEVINILQEFFPTEPLLWQCGKYLLRCLHKNNLIEDLQKLVWYAEKRIKQEKEKRKDE